MKIKSPSQQNVHGLGHSIPSPGTHRSKPWDTPFQGSGTLQKLRFYTVISPAILRSMSERMILGSLYIAERCISFVVAASMVES